MAPRQAGSFFNDPIPTLILYYFKCPALVSFAALPGIMKKFVYILTATATLLASASILHAQNMTAKMDSEFKTQSRNGLLMGNLLVAAHGKVVYQRSFGLRNIAARQPNTTASAFALASVSKQFTATAVLQLKERGKLRLDDHLALYFPDFPFPEITIRQLLNQTSGLPDYQIFDALIEKEPGRVFGNKDIIPALKLWNKGLGFKPGEDWQYANMNYCLLALLVEKLSAQTLQNYLTKNIFRPSGMQHTYVENLLIKTNNPDRTANYEYPTYYAQGLVNVDSIAADHQMSYNLGGFYGQGGLTTTAEDLLLFDNAFFSGKLINHDDFEAAMSPVKLKNGQMAHAGDNFGGLGPSGYGFGWFILNDTTKGKIVWHDGSRPGISAVHLHNLLTDQTVILLENTPEDGNATAVCAYRLLRGEVPPVQGIPMIRLYSRELVHSGADAAAVRLSAMRHNPTYRMPADYEWVHLSYELSANKSYAPLALEALKTAILVYPENNWYIDQGYAIALEAAGKKDLAIFMFKKCLAENPNADYAQGRLKVLEPK